MRKLLPHHTACLCQRASLYEKLDPLAWGQGADDAAVRNRSLLALAQQVVQHPAQRFQVGNLPVNVGQVVSRTELTEHLYAQDFDRDSNTIEVFVGRLRKKLPQLTIETVRGLGYRLVAA